MTRLLLAVMALGFHAAGQAAELAVVVKEAEARSGPGDIPPFYATDKLRPGDQVEIQGEKNGFLVITPPRGAFSLVPKSAVRLVGNPGDKMGVVPAGAETIVGSSLSPKRDSIGSKLSAGAIVKIYDEVQVADETGPTAYYRIEPAGEVRYLPADAVQRRAPVVEATRLPPTTVPPAPLNGPLSGDVETLRRQADLAYRQAESTGDYTEANRLYQALAQSPHADARWEALNRLEFIRQRNMGRGTMTGQPIVPAAYRPGPLPPPQPAAPRYSSGYIYAQDRGTGTFVPVSQPNLPASMPPVAATKPAPLPVSAATVGPGILRRAHNTDQGRTLYYLEDRNGQLTCYVLPTSSVNLEPLVGRLVQISGSVPVYHGQLRADFMTATQATLVQ